MRASTPAVRPIPAIVFFLTAGICAVPSAEAQRAEGSFQRTLTVQGDAPDIDVSTGSGRIEVRAGSGGTIQIEGRIRANDGWGNRGTLSADERVRRLEANPPIEQQGNVVRIGHIEDEDLRQGVSISYTLTVPAGSNMRSRTGSGSQEFQGVTGNLDVSTGSGSLTFTNAGTVRASTGSGSIEADGVRGSFEARSGSGAIKATGVGGAITAKTGSGSIALVQAGSGDVQVSSGSGSVNVQGVKGGLQASTASGRITVQGELAGDWRLSTSSGGVDIDLPAGQGFQLDATTSSGRIETDFPVTVTGTVNRRSLRGASGSGGPLLQVRTTSGSIEIK